MDKSKEYIQMCEKAVEIQRELQFPEDEGSVYVYVAKDGTQNIEYVDYEYLGPYFEKQHIWLPRQDQLQEMIKNQDTHAVYDKLNRFITWLCGCEYWDDGMNFDHFRKYSSLEQLWLAFVMHEKYGKTWYGMDWVKEKHG